MTVSINLWSSLWSKSFQRRLLSVEEGKVSRKVSTTFAKSHRVSTWNNLKLSLVVIILMIKLRIWFSKQNQSKWKTQNKIVVCITSQARGLISETRSRNFFIVQQSMFKQGWWFCIRSAMLLNPLSEWRFKSIFIPPNTKEKLQGWSYRLRRFPFILSSDFPPLTAGGKSVKSEEQEIELLSGNL